MISYLHWLESLDTCIKRLKSHSLNACIERLESHRMQALVHCEVFKCMHWPTMKSINAGIDPLWSLPMQALAHCEVFQCRHWPTVKSTNAGIGPLWSRSMQTFTLYEVIQCQHWTNVMPSKTGITVNSGNWVFFNECLLVAKKWFFCLFDVYKVWTPMFGHRVYLFRHPPSSIKLDHNVLHNSKADTEDIFIH